MTRRHASLLALLFLLALLPRLYHVNSRFVTDADHNTSNWAAYARSFLERGWLPTRFGLVTNASPPDGQPPSYFSHHPPGLGLLTSLSFLLFGTSEAAARIPPLLASAATCPLLYLLFTRILAAPWALLAAVIFALSPGAVHYGQMLNPEAFMGLLGALALYAWSRFDETGRIRWWRLSLVAVGAAVLLDWPGTYIAPALGAASYLSKRTRPRWIRLSVQALAVAAGLATLVIAHILYLKGSAEDLEGALALRVLSKGDVAFTWGAYVTKLVRQAGQALGFPIVLLSAAGILLAAGRALGAAWLGRRRAGRAPGGGTGRPVALAAGLLVCGTAHHLVFTNACMFNPALIYLLIPSLLLFAAAAPCVLFGSLSGRLPRPVAAAVTIAAIAPSLSLFAAEVPGGVNSYFNTFGSPGHALLGQAIHAAVPKRGTVLATGSVTSPQLRFYAWRRLSGNRRTARDILGAGGDVYLLRGRNTPLPDEVEERLRSRPRRPMGAYDLYSMGSGAPLRDSSGMERPEPRWEIGEARFGDLLALGLHSVAPDRLTIARPLWIERYLGVAWTPARSAGRIVYASFVWERLAGRTPSLVPVYRLVSKELGEEASAANLWPMRRPEANLAALPEGASVTEEAAFFVGESLPEGEYAVQAVVLSRGHLVGLEPAGPGGRHRYYLRLGTVTVRRGD